MAKPGPARIEALYRYPVKGLTPEPLESVVLTPHQAFPFDRVYAIENGAGPFDPANPTYQQKIHFVMLMRNEQLATLRSRFDDETHTLELSKDGKAVARGDLRTKPGRDAIENLIAETVTSGPRGRPPDRCESRPQLFRRRGEMRAYRQLGERPRARDSTRSADRPPPLPLEHRDRRPRRLERTGNG